MMTQTPLSAAIRAQQGIAGPARTPSPSPTITPLIINSLGPRPTPLAQLHPRKASASSLKSNPGRSHAPLAQPYPRKPFAPFVNGREAKSVPLAQPHPRNRFVALIQFLRATDRGSRATEILIANPELEFRSTHRKISPLRISNRKYLAIFHLISRPRRRTSPNFQNGNPFGSAPLVYPELRRAQLHPRNRFAHLIQFLRATDRGSRATEILSDGSAIRNPCKALKT